MSSLPPISATSALQGLTACRIAEDSVNWLTDGWPKNTNRIFLDSTGAVLEYLERKCAVGSQ